MSSLPSCTDHGPDTRMKCYIFAGQEVWPATYRTVGNDIGKISLSESVYTVLKFDRAAL